MNSEDRERLVRIEQALLDPQSGVVARMNNHGGRIRSLENVALFGKIVSGGVVFGIFFLRDVAVEWVKKRIEGGQ